MFDKSFFPPSAKKTVERFGDGLFDRISYQFMGNKIKTADKTTEDAEDAVLFAQSQLNSLPYLIVYNCFLA